MVVRYTANKIMTSPFWLDQAPHCAWMPISVRLTRERTLGPAEKNREDLPSSEVTSHSETGIRFTPTPIVLLSKSIAKSTYRSNSFVSLHATVYSFKVLYLSDRKRFAQTG